MIKELKDSTNFNEEVQKEYIVVDFYATWCGPCSMLSPVLEEIAEEKKIEVLKVDIDKFPEIASRYGVMVIPTLVVFAKGNSIKSNTGLLSKSELETFLTK